jgi:hypothetical protein
MWNRNAFSSWVCGVVLVSLVGLAGAQELKPEDLVARHLQSIGAPQARAAAQSRVAAGPAQFKILVGGAGKLDGKATLVSQGARLVLLLKFSNADYRGEQLVCDGKKVRVVATTANQRRSLFGELLYSQNVPLLEGLLGGVISTAWPLLDLQDHQAKLSLEGTKKFEGQSVYDLLYRPKRGTDWVIHLYFDTETFHHVATLYTISVSAGLGRGVTDSARQEQSRFRIEERFSDFQEHNGLTLPQQYDLHFTEELQNGSTTMWQWNAQFTDISDNVTLDPRNFEVK